MLTREEGQELYSQICARCFAGIGKDLMTIVESFIEKPKTHAKIGYYYKDGYGNIEMIEEITPIRIFTNYHNSYLLDGTEFEGADPRNALDLSKPYKLVEVENVD